MIPITDHYAIEKVDNRWVVLQEPLHSKNNFPVVTTVDSRLEAESYCRELERALVDRQLDSMTGGDR